MGKLSWTDRVNNEVLERIGERRRLLQVIRERKKNWTLIETGVFDNGCVGRNSLWKEIKRKEEVQDDR